LRRIFAVGGDRCGRVRDHSAVSRGPDRKNPRRGWEAEAQSLYEIADVSHSHVAAEKVVELVRLGKAELLMKGNLHMDELLTEIVRKDTGLRTERRISHVLGVDAPTYPKALFNHRRRFADEVRALVESAPTPVRWFIVDAGAITDLDYSAAQSIRDLVDDLARQRVGMVFARVSQYL
jgi:hypothetical protein